MRDNASSWARAAFILPFVAAMVLLLTFSCELPGSDNGAATTTAPSESGVASPQGATIVTTPPTDDPLATAEPSPDEAEIPVASPGVPMDGQDADVPEGQSPGESTPTPAPPVPVPGQVDLLDPVAVSRAAVLVMWTSDTTKDSRPGDAMLRAAPYLSQELNEAARTAPAERIPLDWVELAEHQGRTEVTAVLADEAGKPPDTPTEAYHAWSLTVSPIGANGWRGVPQNITVFVTLARPMAGQPWYVTGYQLS